MSDRRLQKNIDKPDHVYKQSCKVKPVIVSDSKGRYLQNCVNHDKVPEKDIIWCFKSGATTFDRYLWIKQNIDNLIKKYGDLSVYIWTGTCDLTTRETVSVGLGKRRRLVKSKYVQLKSSDAFSQLQRHLLMIKRYLEGKNVKLTFLHVPFYSIEMWNTLKKHPTPRSFKADDQKLSRTVSAINEFIDKLNKDMHTFSPKLNEDMRRTRKSKNKKPRYSLRLTMLSDGVHPKKTLAKSWLKSVCRKIKRDCC